MKKSLLFVAAMFAAFAANAQGVWTNPIPDGTDADAVVYATSEAEGNAIEVQAGITGLQVFVAGATDWLAKPSDGTFTALNGVEYSNAYIQGNTNGSAKSLLKDGAVSSHIQLVPSVAGTAYVAAKYGNNKPIWAAKVPQNVIDDEELDYGAMEAYLNTYEGLYIKDDGTYGGTEAATDAVYAALPLAVEPGYTYFFWVSGSKLMLSGVSFTAGEAGISNIVATKDNANAPIYNLAGQQVNKNYKGVVIQNGKKFIQ